MSYDRLGYRGINNNELLKMVENISVMKKK